MRLDLFLGFFLLAVKGEKLNQPIALAWGFLFFRLQCYEKEQVCYCYRREKAAQGSSVSCLSTGELLGDSYYCCVAAELSGEKVDAV